MNTPPPPSEAAASPSPRRSRRGKVIGAAIILCLAAIVLVILNPLHLGTTTPSPGVTNNGCPSSAAVPPWPHSATITLTNHTASSLTSLTTGDTVEFAFDQADQFRWRLHEAGDQFQLLTPAGYFDPARDACIWRFTAHSLGAAVISFTRQPVCTHKIACPPIIIEYRYGFGIG